MLVSVCVCVVCRVPVCTHPADSCTPAHSTCICRRIARHAGSRCTRSQSVAPEATRFWRAVQGPMLIATPLPRNLQRAAPAPHLPTPPRCGPRRPPQAPAARARRPSGGSSAPAGWGQRGCCRRRRRRNSSSSSRGLGQRGRHSSSNMAGAVSSSNSQAMAASRRTEVTRGWRLMLRWAPQRREQLLQLPPPGRLPRLPPAMPPPPPPPPPPPLVHKTVSWCERTTA